MENQYSWKRTQDIEIDLTDLLRQLCIQWKQILICALAAAMLAGGYGYVKNSSAAGANLAEDEELAEEELKSVMSAVELHKDIKMQEEYLEGSVLMKADPYHKHRICMLYSIEQAERQDIQKITENYINFIVNGGAASELIKSGIKEWDMDKSYLAELITAYQKNYSLPYQETAESAADKDALTEALFYAEVTGADEGMASQLAADMQSVLKKQYAKVRNGAGKHKLTLVSAEHNILADNSLLVQQRDKRTQLKSNTENLKAATDAFNDKQLALYHKEARMEDEKREKDEVRKENTFAVLVKYIILGLAGGIFVYCGIFVCWYLFRDTVKSEEEMKNLYTFPFYGGFSSGKQADEQLVNRIRLACKKQGITKLYAAADFSFYDYEKESMEHIALQLENFGIHTVIAEDACRNTGLWDAMSETGNVLLVCRIGTSTHQMIDDAMRFYLENGITVTGAVAFSRYR